MNIKKYLFVFYFVYQFFLSFSQTYQFKVLSSENSNIYPYIYSLHQDSLGYLWIGTGDGLFLYDGNVLSSFPLTFISGDNFISASTIDNKGISYLGLNNGAIAYRINQKFYLIKESLQFKSTITQLQFYKNELWVAVQNKGIFRIANNHVQKNPILLPNIQTYCFLIKGDKVLIGTSEGVYIYANDQLTLLSNLPQTKIESIHLNIITGSIFIGTEDEGIVEILLNNNKIKILKNYAFINNIKDIVNDSEGNIWVATMGDGIYFYRRNNQTNTFSQELQFTTDNGLSNMQIRKLFFDRENNLWIGTYGGGLYQYYESAFSQILQKYNEKELSFTSLYSYNEFLIAATGEGKLFRININAPGQFNLFEIKELIGKKINCLFVDNKLVLWIGTENNGLFLLDLVSGKIIRHIHFQDELQNNISSIDGFGSYRCIGTKNGLLIFYTEEKGYDFQKITTAEGLPHNFINQVLCDVQGNAWIVTPTNFITKYNFASQKITLNKININDILKINAAYLDQKKQLWIATYGNGVIKIDTAIYNYTTINGLFSDYTYSIIADELGTVWVGHRQGISSIKGNNIRTFSKNIGLYADCNPNAVSIDKNGSVWFGTTKGILRYNFKKSVINKHPPTVLVTSIKINDVENTINPYIELESGRYKIQFSFTGISLRESEGVTFQYMLEGYDIGWSEITNNRTAMYPRLDEGTYTFKVLAYNYDKVVSTKPYSIVIHILPPFYKRWWFIVFSIVLMVYIFYLIIKIRERNLRRMERILKEKLDQRTKEVVKQKELIERKNKDITDSIQYAKRIQEAILPSFRIMHENFPQSFVFYQPRDIVSGDFYMFHQIGNNFIFICADATGHGVPGAFMSLISCTILKDILHLQVSISPSQLLYKLDNEISGIFNQENSETQDGLDLSVCLFDTETNTLTYSAAMRPLLIFSDGKWTYYKGNRHSIGFSKYDVNKVFVDTKIKLKKGDRFYLFTDGLPDQFSSSEQKLKVRGLIHWLEEIQGYTMIQQQVELQKRFYLWKGNQLQIDDILIMGIEV